MLLVLVVVGERRTMEVITSVVGRRVECESVRVEVEIVGLFSLLMLGCNVKFDADVVSLLSVSLLDMVGED